MKAKRLVERIPGADRLWHSLHDHSLRYAFFVFILTRLIVFTIFILGTNLTFMREPITVGQIKIQEAGISLRKAPIARNLRPLARQGDSGWYILIAQTGYEKEPFNTNGEHRWVYFPLFPLFLRLAAFLTGGYDLTGIVLSNILFLPALILLHKIVGGFGYGEDIANRVVFYIAAYPTSYFFSLPMTESLYLLLTVGAFYAALRYRWSTAGWLGALASATRPTGIILLPALLVLYWERRRGRWQWQILGLLLVPTGLVVFMIYLHFITGNALAFKDAQSVWGRHTTFFLVPLYDYLTKSLEISLPWYFVSLHFIAAVLTLACGMILIKWRKWTLALYTLANIILPLSTYNLNSLARYVMTIFPVFITLAVAGRYTWADQTIRAIFLVLLALLSALYAAHFSFTFP